MTRRAKLLIAAGLGLAVAAGGAGAAYAYAAQGSDGAARSARLRASGHAGEQVNGYMHVVGDAPRDIHDEVNAVNIVRRALYTELARRRGVTIEEAAASTACQIFATRVQPGQYYRLSDGVWRRRNGSEPVPLPSYCN